MTRRIVLALLALASIAASPAREHYHWYPASTDARPRPWAILFPRAMGVGKLASGNQYVEFARFLNARRIDVIVIDDDRALKLVATKGGIGDRLAALAVDALADARERGRADFRCPGIAVGWSRGGEGALTLASMPDTANTAIKAAVVFYPSVRGQPRPWPQRLPVLALQGTADSLAPHARLETLAASRAPQTVGFTIKLYPGAKHRFDVARPIDRPDAPTIEKDYDAEAHRQALAEIDAFLKANEISTGGCALD